MIRWAFGRALDKFEWDWNDNASYMGDWVDGTSRAAKLISRVTLLLATALIGGFSLAAPAAAQVANEPPAVSASTLTPERMTASMAVVVGLLGAVIGGRALARSARRIGNGRRGAIVALVMGPIGLVMGGLVVATADGGLGTGNGLGGGIVAMMVGLIGMALGGVALVRSRRPT